MESTNKHFDLCQDDPDANVCTKCSRQLKNHYDQNGIFTPFADCCITLAFNHPRDLFWVWGPLKITNDTGENVSIPEREK